MKNILLVLLICFCSIGCVAEAPTAVADDVQEPAENLTGAPEFNLASLAGGTISSEDLKGKVVVVDFYATWCAPCIKEIPDLNTLYNEHDDDSFAMIGITIESGSIDDVKEHIRDLNIEYPVAMGDEAVQIAFGGILGFPTKFVIGPDWKIYKKYLGGEVKDQIEQDILALTETSKAASR